MINEMLGQKKGTITRDNKKTIEFFYEGGKLDRIITGLMKISSIYFITNHNLRVYAFNGKRLFVDGSTNLSPTNALLKLPHETIIIHKQVFYFGGTSPAILFYKNERSLSNGIQLYGNGRLTLRRPNRKWVPRCVADYIASFLQRRCCNNRVRLAYTITPICCADPVLKFLKFGRDPTRRISFEIVYLCDSCLEEKIKEIVSIMQSMGAPLGKIKNGN